MSQNESAWAQYYRKGEGNYSSFHMTLFDAFQKADQDDRRKIASTWPQWFNIEDVFSE